MSADSASLSTYICAMIFVPAIIGAGSSSVMRQASVTFVACTWNTNPFSCRFHFELPVCLVGQSVEHWPGHACPFIQPMHYTFSKNCPHWSTSHLHRPFLHMHIEMIASRTVVACFPLLQIRGGVFIQSMCGDSDAEASTCF